MSDLPPSSLDTSSYPILLLHELPFHPTTTLISAITDLENMLLESSDPPSFLDKFAAKVLIAVRVEVGKKETNERVRVMLLNDQTSSDNRGDQLDELINKSKVSINDVPAQTLPSTSTSSSSSSSTRKFRIPLPSERRSRSAQEDRMPSKLLTSYSSSAMLSTPNDDDNNTIQSLPPSPTSSLKSALTSRSQNPPDPPKPTNPSRRKSQYSQSSLNATSRSRFNKLFSETVVVSLGSNNSGGLRGRMSAARKNLKVRNKVYTGDEEKGLVDEAREKRRAIAVHKINERFVKAKEMEGRRLKRVEKARIKMAKKEESMRLLEEDRARKEAEMNKAAKEAEQMAIIAGKTRKEAMILAAEAASSKICVVDDSDDDSDDGESLSDGEEEEKVRDDEFEGIELHVADGSEGEREGEDEDDNDIVNEEEKIKATLLESYTRTSEQRILEKIHQTIHSNPIERSTYGFYASPPPVDVVNMKYLNRIVTSKTVVDGNGEVKSSEVVGVDEEVVVVEEEVAVNNGDRLKGREVGDEMIIPVVDSHIDEEIAVKIDGDVKAPDVQQLLNGNKDAAADAKKKLRYEKDGDAVKRRAANTASSRSVSVSGSRDNSESESGHENQREGEEERSEGEQSQSDDSDRSEDEDEHDDEDEHEGPNRDSSVYEYKNTSNNDARLVSTNTAKAESKESFNSTRQPSPPHPSNTHKLKPPPNPPQATPAVPLKPPNPALKARLHAFENRVKRHMDEGDVIGAEKEINTMLSLDVGNVFALEQLRLIVDCRNIDVGGENETENETEGCDSVGADNNDGNDSFDDDDGEDSSASDEDGVASIAITTPASTPTQQLHKHLSNPQPLTSKIQNTSMPLPSTLPSNQATSTTAELETRILSSRQSRLDAAKKRQEKGWTPRTEIGGRELGELVGGNVKVLTGRDSKDGNMLGLRRKSKDREESAVSVNQLNSKPPIHTNLSISSPLVKTTKFTDIYPNFSHIFSSYHERSSLTTSIKVNAPSSSGGARRNQLSPSDLAAGMHFQWWLYSVFGRVMEDYSCVFSDGKKSKEVGSGLNDDDDGDSSNSDDDDDDDDSGLDWNPTNGTGQAAVYNGTPSSLHYRVNSSRAEVYNIVTDVLSNPSTTPLWTQLPTNLGLGTTWNLLWTWSKPKVDFNQLLVFQKVNHFRGSKVLCRKDMLKRCLQKFCANIGGREMHGYAPKAITDATCKLSGREFASNAFDIMPQTFLLPQEFNSFITAFTLTSLEPNMKEKNFWIMKPVSLSRGRGISLINDIGSVSYSEQIVMQKYLLNPLLLDGYKFDLRIYVLVTSFSPLEAFIYKEGFARLSSEKFSLRAEDLKNNMVHLTNSSIQKHAKNGMTSDNPAKSSHEDGGNKVSLTYLWKRLAEQGVDTASLWSNTCDVVLKTLVCCNDSIPHQPNAFEIYGFDVIFDDALKPWLIEVNSSPAMARETKLDEGVKEPMVRDAVRLVGPVEFDRGKVVEVCERRMKEMQNKGSHRMAAKVKTKIDSKSNSSNQGQGDEITDPLEKDLRSILLNKLPRQYGEIPECLGGYERLAPGEGRYERIVRLKRKLFKTKDAVGKTN